MLYNQSYYKRRHESTLYSATRILEAVNEILPSLNSTMDLGCGVGTWLSVAKEKYQAKVLGVDGPWVDKNLLVIDPTEFCTVDLSGKLNLDFGERFDLAMSLEVAEHVPQRNAHDFVAALTGHSDFVLMSAAIHNQGGTGHVNEQWPDYWINLFKSHGYIALDLIRKRVWDDSQLPYWYRQNTLLYVKESRLEDLNIVQSKVDHIPPELYIPYLNKDRQMVGLKQSIRLVGRACRHVVRQRFGL